MSMSQAHVISYHIVLFKLELCPISSSWFLYHSPLCGRQWIGQYILAHYWDILVVAVVMNRDCLESTLQSPCCLTCSIISEAVIYTQVVVSINIAYLTTSLCCGSML